MSQRAVVARDPAELPPGPRRAVAIGNFDGVHVGHKHVLNAIQRPGFRSTVVTFDPHPREFFGQRLDQITPLSRRIALLEAAGVEEILILSFDATMASLQPTTWVDRYLRPIDVDLIVVGEDFRFGRGRAGDVELLRSLGFQIEPVPLMGEASSSRVRELIREGDLDGASRLLGRSHEIDVTVIMSRGDADRRKLRLRPESRRALLPASGVFSGALNSFPAFVRCIGRSAELIAEVSCRSTEIGRTARLMFERPVRETGLGNRESIGRA